MRFIAVGRPDIVFDKKNRLGERFPVGGGLLLCRKRFPERTAYDARVASRGPPTPGHASGGFFNHHPGTLELWLNGLIRMCTLSFAAPASTLR